SVESRKLDRGGHRGRPPIDTAANPRFSQRGKAETATALVSTLGCVRPRTRSAGCNGKRVFRRAKAFSTKLLELCMDSGTRNQHIALESKGIHAKHSSGQVCGTYFAPFLLPAYSAQKTCSQTMKNVLAVRWLVLLLGLTLPHLVFADSVRVKGAPPRG